jgi:sugar phosphate isomerase/epimerase
MPHQPRNPDERTRASDAARRALIGLARDRGAEFITRPMFTDSEMTVRDLEPLDGARAARDIELGARHAAREYIRQAREAEHSWDQIGQALAIAPNAEADQTGPTVAEATFTYTAGHPDTEAPWQPRTFLWTCRSCDQPISDRGLIGGPADDELGHAEDCPRLATAIAEWNAGWEAEP